MTHPTETFRVGCVILGAGAGTRFGEPKAGAELHPGVRFIDAIAHTAREAGLTDIVAVLHPDVASPVGVRHVVNPNPASEQIVSLRLGLAQLVNVPVSGTLIWPVDHPFVTHQTIAIIIEFVRSRHPLIARPAIGTQHGHPVYFSRDVWRDLVTEQEGGARAVVHRFAKEVADVAVSDPGVLRNIDARSDLT